MSRPNRAGCLVALVGDGSDLIVLPKLATYERQNQRNLALQESGKVERPLFMLDWLKSSNVRGRPDPFADGDK